MKKQHLLTLVACVVFIGSPLGELSAQDTPTPAAAPAEASKTEAVAKPVDADKEKFAAVKKQANEDPKVKAGNDAAAESKRQATLKMYAKMRELDPSLGAQIDKEEAKLKAKDPKLAAKPAAVKPAADKPAADKKTATPAPAKDKAATPDPKAAKPTKDKTAAETKTDGKPATP